MMSKLLLVCLQMKKYFELEHLPLSMQAIGSLVAAVLCLAYGAYCVVNDGTHQQGKGWASREESPKGFIFAMAIYFILGISSLIYFIYLNFIR